MRRQGEGAVDVALGYAAGADGGGVAYAAIDAPGGRDVLRLPFRLARISPLIQRAAAYAALVLTARALRRRGIARARFLVPDAEVVEQLTLGRAVPDGLALAYVRLRCALNALQSYEVTNGGSDELMQRARAEVALNLAA